MYGCIQSSIFIMNVDIYQQTTEQNEVTNEISRKWAFFKNIPCSVSPIRESGGSATSDNKIFSKEYIEELETKIYTMQQLSKRWRATNIKNIKGESVYNEMDRTTAPPTIFEVYSSHPILDIFGNVQYYENHLKRVMVQEDDFGSDF